MKRGITLIKARNCGDVRGGKITIHSNTPVEAYDLENCGNVTHGDVDVFLDVPPDLDGIVKGLNRHERRSLARMLERGELDAAKNAHPSLWARARTALGASADIAQIASLILQAIR